MVFTKKRVKRKFKRNKKKTSRRPRIPRPPRADYNVKLRSLTYQVANNSTVVQKGALDFSLSQCQNYIDYVKLFDAYRINLVVVKFTPVLSMIVTKPYDDTTTPSAVNQVPRMVIAPDHDDSSVPIDFLTVQEKQKSRVLLATQHSTWKMKPNRLVMVYRSPTSTGYKRDESTIDYLDCAQADIPHYGLKWALEPATPSNCYVYDVSVDYYVSFKDKRT